MTTTFQQVFDKIREIYEGTGNCAFDVFVKQADGQTMWELKVWSYRDVIRHFMAYVYHYPNGAIAITHYGKLIASAYWANGDVYFQHFPNSIYFEEYTEVKPEPFNPYRGTSPDGMTNYLIVKWIDEISNHLR